MSDLKRLSREAIPAALEKANRYRLLNEPAEAESICLDILQADPENQEAIITLLLALTDRFTKGYGVGDTQAKELRGRIKGEYERAYYTGILAERRAKTKLAQNTPDCRFQAYDLLHDAIVSPHSFVPKAFEGQGIGSALVKAGLAYARDRLTSGRS